MEFLGTVVNLIVLAGIYLAVRDWFDGLRSEVADTRAKVIELRQNEMEHAADSADDGVEATKRATQHLTTMTDMLVAMRELREEVSQLREMNRIMGQQSLAVGDMVKVLVQGRQADLEARKRGESR